MTPAKFDSIVANKTSKIVEDRLRVFRATVLAALRGLYAETPLQNEFNDAWRLRYDNQAFVLAVWALNPCGQSKLPAAFFESISQKVSQDILGQLNLVQQAILTPPPGPDAPIPAGEKEKVEMPR